MNPRILVVIIMIGVLPSSAAQPMMDGQSVTIKKGFFGTQYKQNEMKLNVMSMFGPLKAHDASRGYAKSAQAWFYPGLVLGAGGGFMIGFPAGSAMTGGEFNAPLFYTGLGVATVGMIMGSVANKNISKAVDAYNGELGGEGLQLNLAPLPDGGVLVLQVGF